MDRTNLPPEFLAALQAGQAAPPQGPDPRDSLPTPWAPSSMGPGGPIDPTLVNRTQPTFAPSGGVPMSDFEPFGANQGYGDPVMAQVLATVPTSPVGKIPPFSLNVVDRGKPDVGDIQMWANVDSAHWGGRNDRISRDVMIYRQHEGGTPSDFDPEYDIQWISAAMSNLVNRLANMMGGLDPVYESQYRDEATEDASQAIENFGYWSRGLDRRYYARSSSGNLQRDEFFYLLLHGAIAMRVLPDVADEHYPFTVSLLDPSTCYPTWGGPKSGLTRMIRIYNQSVSEILDTYERFTPGLAKKLLGRFGKGNDGSAAGEFMNQQVEIIEYYDSTYRGVITRDGIEILAVKKHGYDFVPFVYVTAVGEPKGMQTPSGRYVVSSSRGVMTRGVTTNEDFREKGVSVLHYLINTNRIKEAIFTLMYAEIEKASAPPTMRYRAAQLMNTDIPDYDFSRNGKNAAFLGLEKVESMPTSMRPTDVAPALQQIDQDFSGGSLNPAAQGMEMGANASGYSLDTLIATAKELILPYLQAYENKEAMVLEMKLRYYRDLIAEMVPIKVPNKPLYGSANAMTDLTVDMVDSVGVFVNVKMRNITDQTRAQLAQTATMLMQSGLYSQRAAMDLVGVANPDKMFSDILAEKALQHPLMQDLFAIPGALKARGATDLANIWGQTVGLQALMQSGLGGTGQPGATPGPPGSGTPAPPDQGGQSNTGSAGAMNSPSPGGPAAGQGRQ